MKKTIGVVPPIPSSVTDPAVRQWMLSVTEVLATLAGQRGSDLDRAVILREMRDPQFLEQLSKALRIPES